MENSKLSSWKNCVTCEFWTGPRRASTFRDRAKYNDNDDEVSVLVAVGITAKELLGAHAVNGQSGAF